MTANVKGLLILAVLLSLLIGAAPDPSGITRVSERYALEYVYTCYENIAQCAGDELTLFEGGVEEVFVIDKKMTKLDFGYFLLGDYQHITHIRQQ